MSVVQMTPNELLDYSKKVADIDMVSTSKQILSIPTSHIAQNKIISTIESFSRNNFIIFSDALAKINVRLHIDKFGTNSRVVFYNYSLIHGLWTELCKVNDIMIESF